LILTHQKNIKKIISSKKIKLKNFSNVVCTTFPNIKLFKRAMSCLELLKLSLESVWVVKVIFLKYFLFKNILK
jgi:hypothetical protein